MKKVLSFLLVLCMLASCCMAFTSCDGIDAKAVEKDPQTALDDATSNRMEEFLSDDAGMGKIIYEALKSGSLALDFEGGKDIWGKDIGINETLYFNQKKDKYVSDTTVKWDEESISARIFVDKNGIAFNSESILGNKDTLLINFSTLAEQFKNSALKDMMEISASDMAEVQKALDLLKEEYAKLFSEDSRKEAEEKFKELINEIYALLEQTVSEEKLEKGDTTLDCVTLTYNITNNTVKELLKKLKTEIEAVVQDQESIVTVRHTLDEAIQSIDDTVDINMTLKVYLNKKNTMLEQISFNGTVILPQESMIGSAASLDKLSFNLDLTFDDNEITLTGDAKFGETKLNVNASLVKEIKDKKVSYKLTVNAGDGKGATVNFVNAEYIYDKRTGDLQISADIYGEGSERTKISLAGSIEVTKSVAKLTFNKLQYSNGNDENTYQFKLSVTFTKSAVMPEIPENAKDIVTMTELEWDALGEDISENSILGKLLGPIFGMGNSFITGY